MTAAAAVSDAQMTGIEQIPTFTMSDFEANKTEFARELGEGFVRFGFVGLQDHGISDELLAETRAAMAEFFALPNEVKAQYHAPGTGGARGYTGFGIETAKDSKHADLKEFYHVGREIAGAPPHPALLPNIWPEEAASFKPAMMRMYDALDTLGNRVLSALSLYLGEAEEFFADKVNYGNSILRPLHYPPITDLETKSVRAGAHEDINLITLLVGSNEPGLEILANDGTWIPVTTIEGTIVCNIGDMMQRLTNHVLPSTTHRVNNPPGEHRLQPRYSIPFFHHFNPDYLIEGLSQCITEENPRRYDPMTSEDYLMQRLREIKLI
ncbi:MAG: 2-oxoglutarate and iron-dependent oxygenase domain-containing protein [Alphaproteobacteria bacterium]